MATAPCILVFDSGVGGLSIAEAIQATLPHCNLAYASDNAAFPYGTKTEDELIQRVDRVLHELQSATGADIIVVACNTASTIALPKIRERFDIPIVGVVPAIKPAAQLSQTKVIGLLATPGTISRPYTHDLVREFASDCSVISLGSSELVYLAEEALRNPIAMESDVFRQQLHIILEPFRNQAQMDTVVLACTHFPLLRQPLEAALPQITYWVDSGDAIARRVHYWLEQLGFSKSPGGEVEQHLSLFTARQDSIQQLKPALVTRGLGDIRYIDVPLELSSGAL